MFDHLTALKVIFGEYVPETITRYFRHFTKSQKPYDVKKELIRIIQDYKNPASSRVQAIRELNNGLKDQGVSTEAVNIDPFEAFLKKEETKKTEGFNEWKAKNRIALNNNDSYTKMRYDAYKEEDQKQFNEWKIKNGIAINSGSASDRLRYEQEIEKSLKLATDIPEVRE